MKQPWVFGLVGVRNGRLRLDECSQPGSQYRKLEGIYDLQSNFRPAPKLKIILARRMDKVSQKF